MRYLPVLLLLTLPLAYAGSATGSVPAKLKEAKERGKDLYLENCWHCHGKLAKGDGPAGATLDPPPPALASTIPKNDFGRATQIILKGKGDMPAFNQVFDKHDAERILEYLASVSPDAKPEPEKPARPPKKKPDARSDGSENDAPSDDAPSDDAPSGDAPGGE